MVELDRTTREQRCAGRVYAGDASGPRRPCRVPHLPGLLAAGSGNGSDADEPFGSSMRRTSSTKRAPWWTLATRLRSPSCKSSASIFSGRSSEPTTSRAAAATNMSSPWPCARPRNEHRACCRLSDSSCAVGYQRTGRHSPRSTPTPRSCIGAHSAAAASFAWKTVAQGAATSIWAGFVASADEVGARYCEDCHVANVVDDPSISSGVRSYALDAADARALWLKSEQMVAIRCDPIVVRCQSDHRIAATMPPSTRPGHKGRSHRRPLWRGASNRRSERSEAHSDR